MNRAPHFDEIPGTSEQCTMSVEQDSALDCWLPAGHKGDHFDILYQQHWRVTTEPCHHGDDPPEYDPDDAEAQRIAEACADASAEHDRIEQEDRAADKMAEAWIFGPRDMPLTEDGT